MGSQRHKRHNKAMRERRSHAPEWVAEHSNDIHIAEEYRKYFHTDIHTAIKELEAQNFIFTPALLEQAKKDEEERIEVKRIKREENAKKRALLEEYRFCRKDYAWISHSSGEECVKVGWEELGIDPLLSLEEKIGVLAMMDTPPEDIVQKEEERRKRIKEVPIRFIKGSFGMGLMNADEDINPNEKVWFASFTDEGALLVCKAGHAPDECGDYTEGWRLLEIEEKPGALREELIVWITSFFGRYDIPTYVSSASEAAYVLYGEYDNDRWIREEFKKEGLNVIEGRI